MSTILVAQTDLNMSARQQQFLEEQGFKVEKLEALNQLDNLTCKEYSGVILDQSLASLPNGDSIDHFRSKLKAPIIVSLNTDDEDVHSLYLELGADDVIFQSAKPRLWRARLDALLRRGQSDKLLQQQDSKLTFGQLSIDKDARRVEYHGEVVDLTTHEFELLWLLASHGGKVVNREYVFEQILGKFYRPDTRTIDVRVSRLRKKLQDNPSRPEKIKTIWRKGYLFVPDVWG
ncbi:winged helix-turn-helix domain-containing protein [Pseudoalteromonas sp. T1lg65]|uniref:winged helix-turn-helix domain-containing protein n=1 Tax=Pseudoalteromonas sp. T1lg65 TaxID=2077101 RepID=UPI003F7B3414